MLQWWQIGKSWEHYTKAQTLQQWFISRPSVFRCRTPACREIIIGHPASVRLGLIKVLCQNIAQPITATEAKPSNLTKITNIDGKVPRRRPSGRSEHNSSSGGWKGCKFDSYQDPISRPSYQNGQRECKMSSFQDPISRPLRTYNEENVVILDHELLEQPTENLAAESETPFKTLQINGIRVSGEKYIEESHFKTPINGTRGSREQQRQKLTHFKTPVHVQNRDLVRNRGRQTHFKTMGKSGTKVSRNLTPFKTPDVTCRTGRVHFKTFDDWIDTRRMNCDTVKKTEEDQQRSYPSRRQPNCQWKSNGDPQTSRSSHIDRGKISMGDYHSRRESTMEHRGKSTMEQNRASPKLQRQQMASNSQRGKDPRTNCHGRCPSSEHFIAKDAKMPKSDTNDSFQDPQPKQRRRVTVKDTNHVVANRATD